MPYRVTLVPPEVNCLLAEFLGWDDIDCSVRAGYRGRPPRGSVHARRRMGSCCPVPAYGADLNEMRDVESMLIERGLSAEYLKNLRGTIEGAPDEVAMVTAPAAARAYAALLTLGYKFPI